MSQKICPLRCGYFALLSMRRFLFGLALCFIIAASEFSARADNIAYMAVYPVGDFGTIDLDTGVFTLLGNSGVAVAGLGVINGSLYASSLGGAGNLYTVNPANGSLTLVGSSGVSYDDFC